MTWSPSSSPSRPATAGLPWPLIVALGAMALLWPLTALTGVGGTGAPRALTILGLTAVVWIGAVGLGRVPHPVLTLTLAGLVFGLVAMAAALLLGGPGGPGRAGPAWTVLAAVLVHVFWGCVAGVLALALQKAVGPRRSPAEHR